MQNLVADHTRTGEYQSDDIDNLTHAIEYLLAKHQSALKAEGMERQVETLKRWLENNRKNSAMASNISETGNAWLANVCEDLKLLVEERQRLEGEGGLPATKEQIEQNEGLLKTIRRIESIIHKNSAPQSA